MQAAQATLRQSEIEKTLLESEADASRTGYAEEKSISGKAVELPHDASRTGYAEAKAQE
jgi:hypothetical protein